MKRPLAGGLFWGIGIGRVEVGGGGTRKCHWHGQGEKYEMNYTGVAGAWNSMCLIDCYDLNSGRK